ncbi:NADH ubiquinone oxidoreductase subunit NDUFA12-domain-containing protein [Powellomyces hirtus]|nr:NADH ubiquinone oxidoreductase subunit NDUFA12-domain-containing protein [Powellomyces hirtus]
MSTWRNVAVGTLQALQQNGWRRTLKQVMIMDQPRVGKHVGTDDLGNNYYVNDQEIILRNRWVEYAKWNHDATQIPSEWHQWLHHITDDVPTPETVPRPFFAGQHQQNLTGSHGAYKPYNTVVPKISEWTPAVKPRDG